MYIRYAALLRKPASRYTCEKYGNYIPKPIAKNIIP